MTSYSSDQFYRDWRYAVAKDFIDSNGNPFKYAEDGKQSWGDELKCMQFESTPSAVAISHKGKHLAIAVDHDIYVLDTTTNDLHILRGHTSRVETLAFQPGNANVLLSCATNKRHNSLPTEPTIIFWDLSLHNGKPAYSDEVAAAVGKHASRTVIERLADLDQSLHLAVAEQDSLAKSFTPAILQALAKNNVSRNRKINGRLEKNFRSNVFSPTGRFMIYLPGSSPRSNGDNAWDVKIYSLDEHKDILTLVGHRDVVTWTGYSSDESLIGTVSWDKTMKIWDATTGDVKYTFTTTGQNWTGGFSPDRILFAGTCGSGSIHVYSLADGKQLFRSDCGPNWCRALDWSPDSKFLVVGGKGLGKMVLIDVEKQQVVQERLLCVKRAKVNEEKRKFIGGFLEVYNVKFVDGGRKIVHFTSGDGSAEVYDLEKHCKWRFARAGTDSYPDAVADIDEDEKEGEVSSKGGFEVIVWEDSENDLVMLGTVDRDAVRLWSVPASTLTKAQV